jgi:hypothetical protein
MNLGELTDLVCGKIRDNDDATRTLVKKWARQRHQMIHDAALWRDTLWTRAMAVTAAQAEIILPAQFERVIAAKLPDALLPVEELEHWFQFDPIAWEEGGTPAAFSHLAAVGVSVLPAGERLSFVSDSASDTEKGVTIEGENAGELVRETLTLNGTTPVLTANSYTHPIVLSKQATTGSVTVTGATSGKTLVVLFGVETQRRHARVRLLRIPTASTTVTILAKRACHPLTSDSASPLLRGIDQAWEALVMGDAWEWKRMFAKAQAKFTEGNALLEKAKTNEAWQQAAARRMVPADPMGNIERSWE